jgi:hypothetical protein
MRILLETDDCQFVVETTTSDYCEGVDAQGKEWTLQGPPLNLPGEVWESKNGETAWRR